MPSPLKTQWVKDWKGFDESDVPTDNPTTTPELSNVKVRYGRVAGRGGCSKYKSISTAASAAIIGLFNYRLLSGTHQICRLLPAAFEVESGSAWNDKTGTALTASAATSRPKACTIDDTLIFTNGTDLPRKYDGTNNTSSIASGTSPYCKWVESYLGFLFLVNISNDGSFTDITDGKRMAAFSDDWDTDWDQCEGNTIILDETPGAWLGTVVLGRSMFAIKSDGIVSVRWTRANEFHQELIDGSVGCVSSLTIVKASEQFAFYLGTDGVVYRIDVAGKITPISFTNALSLINDTASLNKLGMARAMVDPTQRTYYLFYDRTGLSNQLLDSYLSINYQTGEFQKGTLGLQIIACSDFKATDQSAQQLLLSTTTLVENFDTTAGTNDDGTSIERSFTTNWQSLMEEGWVKGARLIFKKASRVRVAVDIAFDFNPSFSYKQEFSLKGGSVSDSHTEVEYKLPAPVHAEYFNLRVRFYHDSTNVGQLERLGVIIAPTSHLGDKEARGSQRSIAS